MTAAGFTVRLAGPADHATMTPLFERFYREEGFARAVEGVAANLARILERADTAAFVAEAGDEVVGVAALSSAFGLEAGLYCELEDLFVEPAWRGRGVGAALVEAAADWGRDRGCRDIEIVVIPEAQAEGRLMPWYASIGFADTGRRIMERPL